MASRFYGGNKTTNKLTMDRYIKYLAPHLVASFALVLYENTDLSVDDIQDLCAKVAPLWERSREEGWDICRNCEELLGFDVKHEKEVSDKE